MKYFFGFLASIALVILAFVLVIRSFSGNSTPQNHAALSDYTATNAQVRMVVDGRIIAEQEHTAYRVTVGRSEVRIETLRGYTADVIDSKTYSNTQESYANFLRALDLAGFTKGAKDAPAAAKDERGVCANGRRYVFELINGTSEIQRYWSTSCGGQGTFKGNATGTKQLFDRQIPLKDFTRLTNSLQL